MKALKHESATYVEQIVSAIRSCYAQDTEPTNAQLTALYSIIGKFICQQGEKAFVAHLAKLLTEQLPQLGGFYMRNLRRMRDFYHAYENQLELMHKAQTLGWTQNAVIMDCCDTDAQRFFLYGAGCGEKALQTGSDESYCGRVFRSGNGKNRSRRMRQWLLRCGHRSTRGSRRHHRYRSNGVWGICDSLGAAPSRGCSING